MDHQPTMDHPNYESFKQENQDLGLDPSDPLNLLLNSNNSQDSSMEDSSSSHGSPPDWSQFSSSLWPQQNLVGENMKPYPDLGLDFLQMDMDFNPTMAVDPSSLQYDSVGYDLNQQLSNEFMSTPFPFTFNSRPSHQDSVVSSNDLASERRSSSSESPPSSVAMSPVLEHTSAVDELAHRVRQTAGVMLAVPVGSQYHQQQTTFSQPTHSKSVQKFQTPSAATSSPSSTASSPGPDEALTAPAPAVTTVPASATSVLSRPKTSHTTIERRYRTNLNARIQSLRQAVPALRVLEEKHKKGSKEGEGDKIEKEREKSSIDIVDERGFVDGVKVARKGSKANVLGKAVEYIRVLKKREARLRREQDGLRSLIGGLVGGPALLKEWEYEWHEKFGGEEKDEIEGEEAEPVSDDEDGDEEGDGDDDDGRARKKLKITKIPKKEVVKKPPTPSVCDSSLPTITPEKRKRGRPRKVPVPAPAATLLEDASSSVPSGQLAMQHSMIQNSQTQPMQQYLLATFALFSFFNSSLTPSSTSQMYRHSHSGSVLGHVQTHAQASVLPYSFGWRELIQVFHLMVSALVFCSIVVPWLPMTIKRIRLVSMLLAPFLEINSPATQSQPSTAVPLGPAADRTSLLSPLAHVRRGASDEADQLRAVLGVPSGILGLLVGWRRYKGTGLEADSSQQRAWVRLGELVASDNTTSTATRLQTYWCMRSHISWFYASTSDLSTLALILRPLSSSRADALWSKAGKTESVKPFERLVLSSMSLEEAATRLAAIQQNAETVKQCPIEMLAATLVRERLLKHASVLFVRTAMPDHSGNGSEDTWEYTEKDNMEEKKRKETIDAGKSLGGRTRDLADALEKVWAGGVNDAEDILGGEDTEADEVESQIRSILSALILYRRIFPSSVLSYASANGAEQVSFILSPPPSPSRKNADLHLALRRALASDVFDFNEEYVDEENTNEKHRLGVALEDARDHVVDMLVEGERAGRNRALKG